MGLDGRGEIEVVGRKVFRDGEGVEGRVVRIGRHFGIGFGCFLGDGWGGWVRVGSEKMDAE